MPKLHQILAVDRDVRKNSDRRITDGYQLLQKPALLSGIARTYRPKDVEGDQFPAESTRVQVRTQTVVVDSTAEFERLWDVVATKDWGNTKAVADVMLEDGTVLISGAPATYLLWLEKQLNDIATIVGKLPVLDPTEEWLFSSEQDCYVTPPVENHKTKKIPRVLVKAPATDKHQADTEVWHEDVVVGYWTTIKSSGALPATRVREMLDRVNAVREAVKVARAKANETEVEQQKIARKPLQYIFEG